MTPSDRLTDIRRSAAFRLTLKFAVIFVGALLVLGLVAVLAARMSLERSAKANAVDLLQELSARYVQTTPEAFSQDLAVRSDALVAQGLAVGLQSASGALLAGEIAMPSPAEGWSDHHVEGYDEDESLWVTSARLPGGGWLNVGASKEAYNDAMELLQDGIIWAFAIAIPLALFSGGLLSRMVLNRLDDLSRTAEAVRLGDLARRAPVRGTGDEFDRLAENLNLMLERSETLTRNLRNVSVGVAHELRTPLARLKNRLEELREADDDRDRRQGLIGKSLEDIGQTLATFDALLAIGQIEADTERSGFDSVDLSELVSDLSEIYEPVISESGRCLSARVDPGVEIRGNRALLTQMIANLLDNALEHTPPGTEISMSLQCSETPLLVVSDNGPGIPSDIGDGVFERFVHGEHRASGTGLGLALVRSICGLHGFNLTLDRGRAGAGFRIEI